MIVQYFITNRKKQTKKKLQQKKKKKKTLESKIARAGLGVGLNLL